MGDDERTTPPVSRCCGEMIKMDEDRFFCTECDEEIEQND